MRTVSITDGWEMVCDEADYDRLVAFEGRWSVRRNKFPYLPWLRTSADQIVMLGQCQSRNGDYFDLRRSNLDRYNEKIPFKAILGKKPTGRDWWSVRERLWKQWVQGQAPGVSWSQEQGKWQFLVIGADGETVLEQRLFDTQTEADQFGYRSWHPYWKLLGMPRPY